MKKLYEYQNGIIKLILDEEPIINDFVSKRKTEKILSSCKELGTPRLVGLEVMLSRGGRICYGMLAAKIITNGNLDLVNVSIDYTEKNTIHYKDSLLRHDENVYKGLQEQYLKYVTNAIQNFIIYNPEFPKCDLVFEYAANCEVGSSPIFFEIIAEMIMKIIYTWNNCDLYCMDIESFTKLYAYRMNLKY